MNARAWVCNRMAEAQLALILLTRLPVGTGPGAHIALASSVWAWPIAGIITGIIGGAVYFCATLVGVPTGVAALLAIAAMILVTGGLHEDGLADLADGCGGGRDRARKLEIMSDSRIGSYGTLALIISVGLRVSSIATIAPASAVVPALIAVATVSRAVLPVWIMILPTAKPNGLGTSFAQVRLLPTLVAMGIGIAFVLPLGLATGAIVIGVIAVSGGCVAAFAYRQLGGQTGDVLGAIQQVTEICAWVALAAVL